ncbi:MAG TPA: hypothetical protein VHI13_05125 [Candidatus Kapabacteria bacterium]|nr:hypothetical protein [Candidatus Kapabacteria bacterium]
MNWFYDYTLILRSTPHEDPEADGYVDVLIPLAGILPIRVSQGEPDKDGLNRLRNVVDQRDEFHCVLKPHTVQAGADPDLPGYGVNWELQKHLSGMYLFIMAVTASGAEIGSPAIPRARVSSLETWEEDDDFWTTEFDFPVEVVLDGVFRPSAKFDDGTVGGEFVLTAARAV